MVVRQASRCIAERACQLKSYIAMTVLGGKRTFSNSLILRLVNHLYLHRALKGRPAMSYAANVHVAVYQVLDDVLRASAAPPGAKAEIYSIIDDLRSASASPEMIAKAEAISLRIHQLESALRKGDQTSELEVRRDLKCIAAAWLNSRIVN
jgi:hypothetical protein